MAGFTPAVFMACRLPWKGLAGCVESWVVPSSRMQMSGADGSQWPAAVEFKHCTRALHIRAFLKTVWSATEATLRLLDLPVSW